MPAVKITVLILYIFFCPFLKAQLDGGLLGILKPEGVHISVPGLLGLSGKKTTTTTTTVAPKTTHKIQAQNTEGPCDYTPTLVNGKRSCKKKLIFQENFAKLAGKKWLIENKFAGSPDYEFAIYQNSPDNVYVKRNLLHIRPFLTEEKYGKGYVSGDEELNLGDTCTGIPKTPECVQKPWAWQILPPAISGQISTKNHFSFVYGTVEIRARFPKGDWVYPEIFLKPKSDFYGSSYNSGTIIVASSPGNDDLSKNLTGGVILGVTNFGREFGVRTVHSENHWNRNFHIFKMEWTPDNITMCVDDEVYGNIYPPKNGFASEQKNLEILDKTVEKWKHGSKLAPFDKEMYLVLGVGIGGQVFKDTEVKPWNNDDPKAQLRFYQNQDVWRKTWNGDSELIVDYVKIWAL